MGQRRQASETEGKTAALGAALARIQQDRDNVSQELSQAQVKLKESDAQVAKVCGRDVIDVLILVPVKIRDWYRSSDIGTRYRCIQ